ncbi:hypothetical protein OG758_48735 [Streptomyces sp. NBC_01474]|uniref:hypothetical protein n=1 Tax=Streptomyces sp. NBC_01474 TaxID=2903880 RepID=UPI002DDBD026|nr:hypothetical protein [Streptomyces sp. NBC_01474]WSE01302.1 hypothetical protein OG758_00055 [Streptomyces sp. NBC_01474]WSE01926.1 hypothetical protein OG758_48735 [Streptomyces sp. NBC_01474]
MLSALAHVEAMETMAAVPRTAFRHHRLSDRPLVIIPLTMAGEAGAPLAAMVGTAKRDMTLLVVPQPRNRDQRFAFAAELGRAVMDYIDSYRQDRRGEGERSWYTDVPQILVPNHGGIKALADLGRMCRFRSTSGTYAVPDVVPEFGMWLTFLVDTAEIAGTSMLLPLTKMLTEHWATGQSSLEDQNLASLMAWIDPPPGVSVAQALEDAENPDVCPPAGPTTSPEFDNRDLAPAIKRFDTAHTLGDPHALATAQTELTELIAEQTKPTWRLIWRAVSILRSVPEAPQNAGRVDRDCRLFTNYSDYRDVGGLPQRKRDTAIGAARRLSQLESALADFEAAVAFDDPFVLADRRSGGEAFAGTVVASEPDRVVVKNRPVPRPHVTVRTSDPLRLAAGTTLISPSMPKGHKAVIVSVLPDGDTTLVTVEVSAGMGRARTPKAGSVPDLDKDIAYLPDPGWRPKPNFPDSDHTPWTHSADPDGPDDQAVPENAAAEEWGHDN